MTFRSSWLSACAVALLASCSTNAEARDGATRIDIPASRLPEAIAELSREAGVSIGAEGGLPALRTPALHGRMSVESALARLLAGSGYAARRVGATAWRIERAPATRLAPAAPPPALSAPDPVAIEPIIVTAPKRAALLDQLPLAVSVIRPEAVRSADPASGTALVAANGEGLAMTALGPGRNRLFLRGVADSAFNGESQSTVAVVLDDARLTYAAPDPDIRLVDVDRVEVLKGPQGSLYGTGALGGIYHIVTRRADPGATTTSAALLAETVAHGEPGWSASAVTNLPLVRDVAALRLVGYAARESGWINTGSRRDSNGNRLLGGRVNLGLVAGGGWRADLSGLMQLLESRDSGYVYAPGRRSRPAQLAEPHDNDMRHVSVRLAREGHGGLDVLLSSALSWHEVGDTLDATKGADGFAMPAPKLLHDDRNYRVWDNEARLGGRLGGMRWLAGFSHVEARQTSQWLLEPFSGAARLIDDDRRNTRDTALFGDVTVPLGNAISIDAGARLFRSTVIEQRDLPAGRVSRHRHRSGMTPTVAVSWKPGSGGIVYLRYGSAYRQGGSDIGAGGQLETLKSDELQTVEAGWRGALGHGGRFDLSLFASRWENVQSDQLQPDGLVETINAGNARILGGEATLDLPLGPSWHLEGGATFTSALLTRNVTGTRLDDRRLPVVPRYTARAVLTRRFPLGGAQGEVKLSLRRVGPQRLSFDPAIDRPMGSYFESQVSAQARLGSLRATIMATNLLGGARDSFAFGNSLRFALARQYTPQRPASVALGIDYAF